MSHKNLSTVATDVIETYGITATNVINSYRFGGQRLLGFVDARIATALNRGNGGFIRSNLADGHQRVSNATGKGLQLGTDGAHSVVGVAVDLATKGVSLMAANAERLDRAANLNALATLNRIAMPAANVVSQVADRIEQGSSELVRRVAGNEIPAKAVASRQLKKTTHQATAARKKLTKTATRRVGKAVAQTATDTSNAARRVARKADRATAPVVKAATDTSNAARRVARKAEAMAAAA